MHFFHRIRRLPAVVSFKPAADQGEGVGMSASTLAGAALLTTANVLSWIGGLLPIRNPFFALHLRTRIRILPNLGFYTLYALAVNLLSLTTSLDDIINGPGPRNQPPSVIKSTFLSTLDHLFHTALFATRFYFVYRSRALLRLYSKVIELSASMHGVLRAGTQNRRVAAVAVFRLPPLIFGFLLLRIGIRTLLEVRYTTNVLLFSTPRETTTTWLQEALPSCVECQWTLHSMLIAFPYFLTAVMPVHFAISIVIPLTDIFQDFYEEVVKSEPQPESQKESLQKLHTINIRVVDTNLQAAGTDFVTVPSLVSRFEEIAVCFTEYSRIFGPMLLFLTMIAVMNTINFISSLTVSHLSTFDNLIVIAWELSTLCFIELGAWAHAKVEDCQDTLHNLLIMPKARLGARAACFEALTDPERNAVAQMICNWKWKINAGRGFFVIDRTLYATVSLKFKPSRHATVQHADVGLFLVCRFCRSWFPTALCYFSLI